jgi:hypothetical protein
VNGYVRNLGGERGREQVMRGGVTYVRGVTHMEGDTTKSYFLIFFIIYLVFYII